MKFITSRDNPLFKKIKKLTQQARARKQAQKTILEGIHLIEEWMLNHLGDFPIFVSEEVVNLNEIRYIVENNQNITILPSNLFNDLSSLDTSAGILAMVPRPDDTPFSCFDFQKDALWLDHVQDPGNLGTLLRTAAAAGVTQILVSGGTDKIWSPKVLRAAMGGHFRLSFFDAAPFYNLPAGQQQIVGTLVNAPKSLYDANLLLPTIWIAGNEGLGISAAVENIITDAISIPMDNQIESLNVAMCMAICLFEQKRQRSYQE